MDKEPIDRYFGTPLSEWVETIPDELERDAVGFWQIILELKDDFGLIGKELIERTRQGLLALFTKGAQPVVASKEGECGWRLKDSYGKTPEEKAESIIQEWLDSKEDPMFRKSLWFALPEAITELPRPGVFYPTDELRPYPGQVYTLPHKGGQFGTRVTHKNKKIMDIVNIPGGPSFLKIMSEEELVSSEDTKP